jgi:hypothetical protein
LAVAMKQQFVELLRSAQHQALEEVFHHGISPVRQSGLTNAVSHVENMQHVPSAFFMMSSLKRGWEASTQLAESEFTHKTSPLLNPAKHEAKEFGR